MNTHYLLMYLRRLKKHPFSSLLILFVLSACLSGAYLTYSAGQYEYSYESFNEQASQTYRISRSVFREGENVTRSAQVFPALANHLKDNFHEVKRVARLIEREGVLLYKDHKFNESDIFNADNDIIDILSIKIISGDRITPLKNPKTGIISKSYAQKYFGDENPLDKTLRLNDELYTITAVFEDVPSNTHLKADVLFSYSTFSHLTRFEESKAWNNFYTYVQLQEGVFLEEVEQRIDQYVKEANPQTETKVFFKLTPIAEINLSRALSDDVERPADGQQRAELLLAASLILFLISLLNYGNISISDMIDKTHEVNVRKAFGANKLNLVRQIVVENLFTCLLTIAIAIVITLFIVEYLTQSGVVYNNAVVFSVNNIVSFGSVYILCFTLVSIIGILSLNRSVSKTSVYTVSKSRVSLKFRRIIFAVQLVVMLVVSHFTLVLISQYNHLKNAELAFDPTNVLVVEWPGVTDSLYSRKLNAFANNLRSHSKIETFAISTSIPGEPIIDFYEDEVSSKVSGGIVKEKIYFIYTDAGYFEVFDIKLLAGRLLSSNSADETNVVVTNKTARLLGFENPEESLGNRITLKGESYGIVGVVNDYHHESFKREVEPVIFLQDVDRWGYFSFKADFSTPQTFDYIQQQWNLLVPDSPFDYAYMESKYALNYKNENNLASVFSGFTLVSVLMIFFGLFGVIALTVQMNLKSLAVKKIMGASVLNLTKGVSVEFLIIVFGAAIISTPISYQLTTFWLHEYASKTEIGVLLFMVPVVMVSFGVLIIVTTTLFRKLDNVVAIIRSE